MISAQIQDILGYRNPEQARVARADRRPQQADELLCLPAHRIMLELKVRRDKLQQYKKRTVAAAAREAQATRELVAKGEMDKARLALRRKKLHESLITQADAQLDVLLELVANVESARMRKDVLMGIEQGTKVLQEIHEEMGGLEHVEKLMGDTAEAVAYQRVGSCPDMRSRVFVVLSTDRPLLTSCPAGTERDARRATVDHRQRRGRGRAGEARTSRLAQWRRPTPTSTTPPPVGPSGRSRDAPEAGLRTDAGRSRASSPASRLNGSILRDLRFIWATASAA
jgi:hypothetical protein